MIEVLNPMGMIFMYTPDSLKFVSKLDYSRQRLLATHRYTRKGSDYILYSSSEKEQLWNYDSDTGELRPYGYSSPEYLRKYLSAQSPFLEINGEPCFFRPYDGLVYKVDVVNHCLVPFVEWDFGERGCTLKSIPKEMDSHEYHDFIVRGSEKTVSPFIDMKSAGNVIFASVVYGGGKTFSLIHDIETGESHFFESTREGMKFLPELIDGTTVYKFVDCAHLPEYVNRDVLDADSREAYDRIISRNGSAIVAFHLK